MLIAWINICSPLFEILMVVVFKSRYFQIYICLGSFIPVKWKRFSLKIFLFIIIRPSSDGTYYGMVMSVRVSVRPSDSPSVRPSDSPSVRPGLRPPIFRTFLLHALTYWAEILHMTLFWCTTDQVWLSSLCVNFWRSYASLWIYNIGNVQFSALFSYMLWHIELKFCIWLCLTVLQIKFECRQFASIFVGVMPLLELLILEIHSSPHFSLTCYDILSWNFPYDFFLMYYRSSSTVVTLRQFLKELCPFWNFEYWKYSFPHFSLTCFDILSWNFAYDFASPYYRSSSSFVNLYQFLWELCPFWNLEYWKYKVFRTILLHALTYWAEILHMTLFHHTTYQVRVSSICLNFCESYAPFGT